MLRRLEFVVLVLTPSRASPLPTGFLVYTKLMFHTGHCGSGLAREGVSTSTKNSRRRNIQ